MITVGIPARNQLEYLRRAVDSVLRCQSLPTQLIIVDDASNVPTARWLDRLLHANANKQITLIRNSFQEGFAYNANLILDAAEGDIIVLLNSDTVVTCDWDTSLQRTLADFPRAGLAGPSTSCTHTPQALLQYRFGRFDLSDSEIEQQGRTIASRYRGKWEHLKHLGGFCYAIARRTFRDVGYFDERFGLGPYEENDYCDRAMAKGHLCIWVKDAYVHHFGGRSFDCECTNSYARLLQQAEQLYKAKRSGAVDGDYVRRSGAGKLWEYTDS